MRPALAVCAMVLATPASAAGKIGTCTVAIQRDGTLKPAPTATAMDSRNSGAIPALVRVHADFGGALPGAACTVGLPLNCARLSLGTVGGFDARPAGTDTDFTFAGRFTNAGSSSGVLVQSDDRNVVLLNGDYVFQVDFTVTKASGMLRTGSYRAVQPITCD